MEPPPSGTNHISSQPYSQTYPHVQQPYGREQDFSGYPQKMGDPYYSSQRTGTTTPIYPTPLPALIEPSQNYPPRGLDGPKIGGPQFGLTSPGYGQGGGTEMGPMMRALTEDDMFMPQPPEYRSPMQNVAGPYGQPMGYTSPDGTRTGYGAGQYPSPFSPGHSPRASQIYPVRSHAMSPIDSGFGANPSQYHRQTSQSPHMNMVSPTGQNSVFNRGTGVTVPSPVGMQGQSMYSHSPGSSQGGRGNTHFPFSTSPVSQHTSPLPSPSSLRSPGVVNSPHNLATASPGPFNTPSNPSPVNVPRPIKSPVAAFQTPAAVTQSGHPLVSPKVRPVDNGDHNSTGTPYVELVHSRNDTQNKTHSSSNPKSPESPYPKKKEDRCSSGHLPKLEEMVAFLGESATQGILTPNDKENSEENGENESKDVAKVDNNSETTKKTNGEQQPPSCVIHTGSVKSAERQPDISSAKQHIIVQENNRCNQGNGSPRPNSKSPRTDRSFIDASPKGPKTNGDVRERSPLPRQPTKSPKSQRGSNSNKDTSFDNLNGPTENAITQKIAMNSSLDSDTRRTQSPQSFKVANDISQVDKNSMNVNNQLKRKFSETQNDVYHNSFNSYPRNGGQCVTAYPLTYTPPNSGKEINQCGPNSPRGSKSPARKAKEDFSDGNPRKVLKTYSGKKKRTSVDKQGNAIVLPSPLLPLSVTDPPKPKEEKQTSSEELPPTNVVKEDQGANPQTSTTETIAPPRSITPTFQNPMTTPSSQRTTPEKPVAPHSQKAPPSTPTGQAISDDPSTPTPTKRRGRPPGSKNKPRKEGDTTKPRKKPVKKNFDMSLEVKDELGKFKHLKSSVKGRSSDSPVPQHARARGPILRITGTRDNPVSSKIVNNPDALATSASVPSKKRGSKHDKTSNKNIQSVSRAPLGPATKQSLTVNNPTGPWLCALCGKPANYDSLGDLYGPYYPPGYQIPILSPQSTHEKTKSVVAAAASKKQQQHVRTNQKGKLKAKVSPIPKAARTSKVSSKGKASRTTSAQRQRKYSDEAEYFMFLEEATTSSGRVSKTPKRMTYEISKVTSHRGGNRRRKSSEVEDRGPCDPNEYWVHEDCVIWTHGVYVVGGTLYGLAESIKATQTVACFECKDKGASLGCMSKGCKKTYHYVCAVQAECQLQVDNYSMICPQHKDKVVKMKDLT
ncbi:histone-lysine N-methyltransferase 2C-like [Patiria miniata]|uniref:PHD-type domain-containing protein n=1 Tax=Patiria miniata TaxID=46514 RepID=A0A913ZDG1_PATMI|nr:histone-lysine N-methyltransferase 2C-like [Patiria miniata]XP_038064177.1 histone-lysine N-methyltransferase 2C-like [Patiria miniata]